ncbi:4-hydroxy-tetrahydrodipicolinate reductase [Serinibacter arcticus]|uniref:4-hydroxy-tetrahydrodipicolinate reductase n=1 Tax=Serinibacter arcticus TaxID=1655435 RepID=A0A2U1ZSV1_9MICO|nr:4-hydroxy-tetrahydrodipicolinate reductase [Serinibacter arcticus]PWD50065.1 4-hydroxy-tetrahydrodipicolinate reductase [Serinibacter arcticus]
MSIRVAVLGAAGRMGSTTVAAVHAASDLELVAELEADGDVAGLAGVADVAIDFTVPQATEANVHALLDAGVHAVVGTTGWDAAALDRVRAHASTRPDVGVLIAPNFALSAVLAMRFAAVAARYFASAEVVEMHHPRKLDAPSGTAVHTAQGIAAARTGAGLGTMADATSTALPGARGADVDGVNVHSLRLEGLVAHEQIFLSNPGELLTIRTDSFDRASFMPGVLLAVREVVAHPGLSVGLETFLGL